MDDLLIGEEAAQYLGVSYARLHQLTKEGIGRKMSGHWVFTRRELDEYRASEKNKGGRPKSGLNPATEYQTPALVAY